MDEANAEPKNEGVTAGEINEHLKFWLNRESPCVLSISGDWGSGKTYWWRNYSKSLSQSSIYVSLFGVNTSQEIEQRLLTAFLGAKQVSDENRTKKGLESLRKLAKEGLVLLKEIPGASALAALESYAGAIVLEAVFAKLDKRIVVFDDIERRGEGLALTQVLSAVSMLRESRNAKVIVILNEEKLKESDTKQLEEFREKVIDCDFRFTISPEDAADIGLRDHVWAISAVADFGRSVDLRNIRVYQRMSSVLSRLGIEFAELPRAVKDRLARSVAGLCWARFVRGPAVPTLDQLLAFHTMVYRMKRVSEKKQEPLPYEVTLGRLNWVADDMDQCLASVVRSGCVPTDEISVQLKAYLDDAERQDAHEKLKALWNDYRSTFFGDDNILAEQVISTVKETKKYVGVGDLSGAAWLLRQLNEDGKAANELVDTQVEYWRKEGHSFRRLLEYPQDLDVYLKEQLERSSEVESYDKIDKVIDFFAEHSDGWNPKEEAALASYSPRDWIELLERTARADLMIVLRRVQQTYDALQSRNGATKQRKHSSLDIALRAIKYRTKRSIPLVRGLLKRN